MILGGYTGSASVDTILAGPPNHLRVVGHLPQPTHDAAAALIGKSVYLLGGGDLSSWPNVVRVDPSTGTTTSAKPLGEPLSDLGAAMVGRRAYVVGGYTGTEFATAVISYPRWHVLARLPDGTRYAGVTAIGRTIYVAGGLTRNGNSRVVYAIRLGGKPRQIATLPKPEAHAALAALNGTLYYVGGRQILAIDPNSGKVKVAARLPVSLADPTATTVGSRIVIAGGGTSRVWAFTP